MSAIDFPSNPTVGQKFTAGGATWTWDGAKWTTATVSGLAPPVDTGFGGFLNKFRNPRFDVWQRGASALPTSAYTADGWFLTSAGTGVTVQRSTPYGPNSFYGAQILGASGNTASALSGRIESYDSFVLGTDSVTVQAKIYNSTGATITPQLYVYHPSAQDNWTTPVTDVGPVNLQPCPNGAWTQVAYTFTVPQASAANGLGAQFFFGGGAQNASGKNIIVAEADIRLTPGWPTGLCMNPPAPEFRPVGVELPFCQRYFETGTEPHSFTSGLTGVVSAYGDITFKVTKRTNNPAITFSGFQYYSAGNNVAFTPALGLVYAGKANFQGTGLTTWQGWYGAGTWTADADLK